MSMIPPLRKLQYVLAVARELHFRKAAEKLHVSQPAVSRQARECEEFGFEILRRDRHFVPLTKACQSFVADLDAILDRFDHDLHQAINKAQAISRQTASEYVVAHSPYAPPAIRRVALRLQQRIFRKFQLRLRILSTTELIAALHHDVIQAGSGAKVGRASSAEAGSQPSSCRMPSMNCCCVSRNHQLQQ